MNISEIKEKINKSKMYYMAVTGDRYYDSENDINKRKMMMVGDGGALVEDPYVANNKIPNAFYHLLINQKIDYLLGKKPTAPIDSETFYNDLKEISRLASTRGVQWVQPYIENGLLKLETIPTYELWPEYEKENLVGMYRLVNIDGAEKVYHYTSEKVTIYEDEKTPIEKPVLEMTIKAGSEENNIPMSWGKVPFIPLYNNYDASYDLKPIKALIDNYDKCISDFANNLEDIQEMYWILKGYNGQDPAEFLKNLKQYKSVPVSEGGEAHAESQEIPHVARISFLNLAEELIYNFGQGVNTSKIAGASLTNVAIKAHFANLDMKATGFSQHVTEFINQYIEFYNIYADMMGIEKIEPSQITYNKTLLINEVEELTSNSGQIGSVSEETRLSNHPWVSNVEEEMERMGAKVEIKDNPIPVPRDNEQEQDFMNRCITFVMNEGQDNETAVAICQRSWLDGQEE